MDPKFEPIIYQQEDPDKPERSVWVRIMSRTGTVSIATFREKPDAETPVSQSMASFDFDACSCDESTITYWDEDTDPVDENGEEVYLVSSIDNWKPREEEEEEEEEDLEDDKVIRERKAREKILDEGDARVQWDAPVIGSITLPRETFVRMVNFVAPFAAEDSFRPLMCAVNMELKDGDLYMVAADAFHLAVALEKVGEQEAWTHQPVMPVDLLTQFVAALPGLPVEGKEVSISFTQTVATLTCASLTWRFLLESGSYPTWRAILPKEDSLKTYVKGSTEAFLAALDSVKSVSEQAHWIIRWDIKKGIEENTKDTVVITAKDGDGKEVAAIVEGATKEGMDLLVVLNHQYMIDVLNRFPEGQVVIGMSANKHIPFKCTYEGYEGYLSLVMPMSIINRR